jgi:8-oxo-dGTP pyrophosphatase MutT (NUDIX family)
MAKIPKNAKRVYHGIIFDVYHWRQKLFDGSLATFEAIRRQPSVIIIPTIGNKIVMLKERQPAHPWFYTLPGGRVESGEQPRLSALRELKEETGMKPSKLVLYRTLRPRDIGKVDYPFHVFIARDCKKVSAQQLDAGERIKSELYSYPQFLQSALKDNYFHGPLTRILLMALIDAKQKKALYKQIFG